MSNSSQLQISELITSANTGLDAIKRAPIVKNDTGIKCLRIQDISQDKDFEDWGFCEVNEKNYKNFCLKANDIIIARTGETVGVNKIIKKDLNAVYNNGLIRLRVNIEKANPLFIYYSFQTKRFERFIDGRARAISTQPNIRIESLLNYKIYNLSISSQNLISSILSTYDELIKNNEKRIKILEEMAQRMYAEWFVIFKFPGYEKVKMVDTPLGKIPEGWRVEKYEDVFDVKYGKNLPTSKLENMGFPVYGAGGIIGYYSEKNVTNKTPLVTCRGNGSGTVWRTFGEGFVTNNSFYILGKNPDMRFEFIFNCLKNSNIMSAVSGSAQPQITIDSINYVKTVFPGIELIQKYQELASPLYLEADLLRAMNDNLGRMRDLLIPQLVTGRREVKHDK